MTKPPRKGTARRTGPLDHERRYRRLTFEACEDRLLLTVIATAQHVVSVSNLVSIGSVRFADTSANVYSSAAGAAAATPAIGSVAGGTSGQGLAETRMAAISADLLDIGLSEPLIQSSATNGAFGQYSQSGNVLLNSGFTNLVFGSTAASNSAAFQLHSNSVTAPDAWTAAAHSSTLADSTPASLRDPDTAHSGGIPRIAWTPPDGLSPTSGMLDVTPQSGDLERPSMFGAVAERERRVSEKSENATSTAGQRRTELRGEQGHGEAFDLARGEAPQSRDHSSPTGEATRVARRTSTLAPGALSNAGTLASVREMDRRGVVSRVVDFTDAPPAIDAPPTAALRPALGLVAESAPGPTRQSLAILSAARRQPPGILSQPSTLDTGPNIAPAVSCPPWAVDRVMAEIGDQQRPGAVVVSPAELAAEETIFSRTLDLLAAARLEDRWPVVAGAAAVAWWARRAQQQRAQTPQPEARPEIRRREPVEC